MENEPIILNPDPARVMDGLRDTGYDFNTAVADIVDNSIAAGATSITITLQMDPLGGVQVIIADNGCGMDFEGLKNAMKYGSKKPADPCSLSKFGLGLKTASTAFCKSLSLISRTASEGVARKVTWDLDHIATENEWSLIPSTPSKDEVLLLDAVSGESSGTVVVWDKVDRLMKNYRNQTAATKAFNKKEDDLRFHLGAVYQRFLDKGISGNKELVILLNGKEVEPWDPFCTSEEMTEKAVDFPLEIELPSGEIANMLIVAYVIPRKDAFSTSEAAARARVSNDFQGFYVYRENRLIHYGNWMGMFTNEPHGTLLRVGLFFGHDLDDVLNVDIKKSKIQMSEELYAFIKDEILPAPRRAADERYRKGENKTVAKAGKDAHDEANRSISEKAKSVEQSSVVVKDEQSGEVEVSNAEGVHRTRIKIRKAEKPGQTRVVPVEEIESSMLWQPTIVDGNHAVEINQSHPYYKKVYFPILEQGVMVTGMDALLWSLAEAELSTFNEDTKEQYENMRIMVSSILKRLVSDLPEPEFGGEE